MKSSPDVENIGQESLFLITKVEIIRSLENKLFFSFIAECITYFQGEGYRT
jgi:hypothetical protein